mmetsp:Transcript_104533/g.291204  ORF Transcript_104533/g.291204 Transcript_104533/m.291204 type:complete len:228 (-) Transcript_104533:2026-2709(-)
MLLVTSASAPLVHGSGDDTGAFSPAVPGKGAGPAPSAPVGVGSVSSAEIAKRVCVREMISASSASLGPPSAAPPVGTGTGRASARAASAASMPGGCSGMTHAATTVMSSCFPPWHSTPCFLEYSTKGTFAEGSSERSCAASARDRAKRSGVVACSLRPTSSPKVGERAQSTMCRTSRSCRLSRKPSVKTRIKSPSRTGKLYCSQSTAVSRESLGNLLIKAGGRRVSW